MSLLEEEGKYSKEEAFEATTTLTEMRAGSTEFYDAPMTADHNEKKKEEEKPEKEKRKVLMANEYSSSSRHQQEEQGHEHQQEKCKAAALKRSVGAGDEERKKTTKVVIKFSPPSSHQQQQQQQQQPREMASLTARTTEDETELWRKMASEKGLSEPRLYFSKTVTSTDTKKEQNRYEISVDDMVNKMALQELAIRVNSRDSVNAVILDKKGREYQVFFKYIPSNGRYRFNGPEWRRFIEDNELTAGQIMRMYGLPDGIGGNYGFAFINTEV